MSKYRNSGSTLTEYALIGLLVVVVGLGGLNNMGFSMNTIFGSLLNIFSGKSGSAAPVVAINAGVPASGMPSFFSLNAQKRDSTQTTAAHTLETLQVSGANGATNELASLLDTRASSLLAAGTITQEQANLLYEMANQGHYLATGQAAYENAVQAGQTSLVFEGKTYKLTDFANLLGFTLHTTQSQNWQLNPEISGAILKPFALSYQKVLQSGMLNDPRVKQEVTDVAMQIGAVSDALSWSADDLERAAASPSIMGILSPTLSGALNNHFRTNMEGASVMMQLADPVSASTFTDTGAAKICSASANGQDNGKACSEKQ